MSLILYEEHGSVAVITFNREDKLNAMNTAIVHQLTELLNQADRSDAIRAIILTGKGKSFVAGADIEEYSRQSGQAFVSYQKLSRGMYEAIENNRKPVIAAVNGYALGGGFELVLACDFVIASSTAKMGLPEIVLGLLPGGGGTQKLARLIGRNRAKEYLMLGKRISADEGFRLGIVNKVVDASLLMDEALLLANELSVQAPLAIQEIKQSVNQGLEAPLEVALTLEGAKLAGLFQTDDAREGIRAFVEKRKPFFEGK